MNKKLLSSVFLFTAAIVWGFAFVAQKFGADNVSPFYFNGIRFLVGAAALLPVVLIFEREKKDKEKFIKTIKAGAVCATILFVASALQQVGINMTQSAGKGAFITSFYSVLVPIFYLLFFRRKTSWNIWTGAFVAIIGLFFVCVKKEEFGTGNIYELVGMGDLILLLGSVFWAWHIIAIDKFIKNVSPVKFAMFQALFCGIYNLIFALPTETVSISGVQSALVPILYCGIFSTGIAYTCQILGQKDADPTIAPIILSTESLFGALGGVIFDNETMNIFGCVLIFAGVLLAQLTFKAKKTSLNNKKLQR
ncbi:MAG: DMT family transporter [Ruminococcaceae bacterium]|nr:DMT family transporter [Oscillospiraceae bacterium]